ncbi:MAG TPA: hypothetical protein VHA11_10320, partial [Bryobacteraceae bacterium]|nr:hypothetical protein [Bryobacteraceae bacterium]
LSPAYPRALLRHGATGWAAISAPPEAGAAGAVTFGLIWLDYLRRRERQLTIEGLALFLPQAEARQACLRLPFLDARLARFAAFVYTLEGYEDRLDPADYGNLDTRLDKLTAPPAEGAAAGAPLAALPFVETVERNDGALSLRVRGLEFARAGANGLAVGLERLRAPGEASLREAEALARELARLRSPGAADRGHPLWRSHPEAWLEAQVRTHLEKIDPVLAPAPVYGQVPALAGGERGVLDMLAAGRDGRLAVLELKASEDIHLPLQALDYWMRVRWHAERGDFAKKGYFPGRELRPDAPRLLLVAPALSFHPKTETILRYFSPEIEVERIGLGVEWRQEPRVMFRIRGAHRPI